MAKGDAISKVSAENVNVPGYKTAVDRVKYEAIKKATPKALPKKPPGLTQQEIPTDVLSFLPQKVFPGVEKVGWRKDRSARP
jgi:hypothetical protein